MRDKSERGTFAYVALGLLGATLYELLEQIKISLCTGYGRPYNINELGKIIYQSPYLNSGTIRMILFLSLFPMIVRAIGYRGDLRNRLLVLTSALGLSVFLSLVTEQKLSCSHFYFFSAFCTLASLEIQRPIMRIVTLAALAPVFFFFHHGPEFYLNSDGPAFRDLASGDMSILNWLVTLTEITLDYAATLLLTYAALAIQVPSILNRGLESDSAQAEVLNAA